MEQKQIVEMLVAGFRDIARRAAERGIRVVTLPELEREMAAGRWSPRSTEPTWEFKFKSLSGEATP